MQIAIKNSTNSVASIIMSALIIVGGTAAVATARAADAEPRRTMIVNYDDLNVDTEQGARVLYARLRLAARDVCASLESRHLPVRAQWLRCYDSALSSAVGQVNKIAVTKLYQASVSLPKARS
jgi:UrcA family protein